MLDSATRIVVPGMTGREGRMITQHMLEYGTNVVAGVTPGKGGSEEFTLPVFDLVEEAVRLCRANAALICVPPRAARSAVLECIDAGIPRIVVATERIPQLDVAYFLAAARASGTVVIGPNSAGILVPRRTVKMGTIGGASARELFSDGPIAIISRSGGMATECATMLKRAHLGASFVVSLGGDALVGFSAAEAARLAQTDPQTEAIVYWGEPGYRHEYDLADAIESGAVTKPLFAMIGGAFLERFPGEAMFGHAAAMVRIRDDGATAKLCRLTEAGARTPRLSTLGDDVAAEILTPMR